MYLYCVFVGSVYKKKATQNRLLIVVHGLQSPNEIEDDEKCKEQDLDINTGSDSNEHDDCRPKCDSGEDTSLLEGDDGVEGLERSERGACVDE